MTLKRRISMAVLIITSMGATTSIASAQFGGMAERLLREGIKQGVNQGIKNKVGSDKTGQTKEQRNITSPDQVVKASPKSISMRTVPGTRAPATAQMGANIKLNMRTAQSLDESLAAMNAPLSQSESMHFMYAFFVVAELEYCYWTGDAYPGLDHRGHISAEECWSARGPSAQGKKYVDRKFKDSIRTYISHRRLDDEKEYVATNGFGNSRRGGHSREQSYVLFIEHYSRMLDGKTRPEIEALYDSYFSY